MRISPLKIPVINNNNHNKIFNNNKQYTCRRFPQPGHQASNLF